MNNVSNIAERRATQAKEGYERGMRAVAEGRIRASVKAEDLYVNYKPAQPPAEALETSLDEYRATMLDLSHRRQAFELQMMLETQTAQIRLEAAGYKALVAGVPESDIYGLGEDMAEALTSAMNTVAGA